MCINKPTRLRICVARSFPLQSLRPEVYTAQHPWISAKQTRHCVVWIQVSARITVRAGRQGRKTLEGAADCIHDIAMMQDSFEIEVATSDAKGILALDRVSSLSQLFEAQLDTRTHRNLYKIFESVVADPVYAFLAYFSVSCRIQLFGVP